MERKAEFKLPQIKKTHKESSTLLSKTISDTAATPKLRPASSNKVDDLEKKLFSKLEAYDHPSRKRLPKKSTKTLKDTPLEADHDYERMQKLMPALYSKLVETKRGNYLSEHLIADLETPPPPSSPAPDPEPQQPYYPTEPQKEEQLYSQEEMESYFREYEAAEGLPAQTTTREMQQLSDSLLKCETSIEEIRRSMEGLIQQAGLEYLAQLEADDRLDFQHQ